MIESHASDAAVGNRLQQARESAGHTLADMSDRTRMPIRSLRALEEGRWSDIGAPVFVRGQLRAYGRSLGVIVDESTLPAGRVTQSAPALVCHVHTPRYRHVAESLGRRAIYIVLTAALVVPVWLATRTGSNMPAVASLDVPPAATLPADAISARTPVVASIAPLPTPAPANVVAVEFSGDSWVQLFGSDGSVIEKGLLHAGDRRELRIGEHGRVVLGNSSAVRVTRGGQVIDLAPLTRANVARFTLSSDGSLAPVLP